MVAEAQRLKTNKCHSFWSLTALFRSLILILQVDGRLREAKAWPRNGLHKSSMAS